MNNKITLARPYAKAVFEMAEASGAQSQWQAILNSLLQILHDPQIIPLIADKTIAANILQDCLLAIATRYLDDQAQNLLKILIANKRLSLLPEIVQLYQEYCLMANGQLSVRHYSAEALSVEQRIQIEKKLSVFFQKNIEIHYHVDANLLGGYVVKVGSLVIDASITGYLERLQGVLCE
jgi:F-type H+-transporting ATPase subunit delta